MNCPHCNMFVPDYSVKCLHCGKEIQSLSTQPTQPKEYRRPTPTSSPLNLINFVIAFAIISIVIVFFALTAPSKKKTFDLTNTTSPASTVQRFTKSPTYTEPAVIINESNPGETIDIKSYLPKDKMTIFDFYSEYCPPCRQIGPLLKQLDEKRADIVVLKVNINRPNVRGIDWKSPVAQQYGLQSIPHFVIYDKSGNLDSEGESAYQKIADLLQREGIGQ